MPFHNSYFPRWTVLFSFPLILIFSVGFNLSLSFCPWNTLTLKAIHNKKRVMISSSSQLLISTPYDNFGSFYKSSKEYYSSSFNKKNSILFEKKNSNTMADYNSNKSTTKPNYSRTMNKRPLYITIGPPCAGKTTFLQKSVCENMIDVTIDDQDGVYVPIDTKYFLVDQAKCNDMDFLRGRMLYNVSLEHRIYGSENDEMRKILQYLSSPDKYQSNNNSNNQGEFLKFLKEHPNYSDMQSKWEFLQKQHSNAIPHTNDTSTTWAEVFDRVLKEFVDIPLPDKVDLFVLDGIFKTAPVPTRDRTKNNSRRPSGLNAAFSQLKRMAHTRPQSSVAWGNTNTVCFGVVLISNGLFWIFYVCKFVYFISILFFFCSIFFNTSMIYYYIIYVPNQ